jgi:hypothetical protein
MIIEDRTIDEVDRVTQLVMDKLLAKQAQQSSDITVCPKCGSPMHDKPGQHRLLQSRRGNVNFKTIVLHCEACRLDFFPQRRTLQCDVDRFPVIFIQIDAESDTSGCWTDRCGYTYQFFSLDRF